MNIRLKRRYKGDKYTIGSLYINGEYFCDTLEDKDRGLTNKMSIEEIKENKVYGQTAIPIGTYLVKVTYSSRFKRNLPLIMNVKGYEGIRIHSGNTETDTLGCILVGENKVKGQVINSRQTMNRLMELFNKSKMELITITIE